MRAALEIEHTFVDTTLDLQHVRTGTVTVGDDVAWRWRFLGVDMGTVPAVLAGVLPWLPPIWSEVDAVPVTPFSGGPAGTVFRERAGRWSASIPAGWSASLDGTPVDAVPDGWDGDLVLQHGDVRLTARSVEAPGPRQRTAPELDLPVLANLAMLGAAGLLFAAVSWLTPGGGSSIVVQQSGADAREVVLQIPLPPPKAVASDAPSSGGEGPAKPTDRASGGPRSDRQVAESAGLLGALGALGDVGLESTGVDDGLRGLVGNLQVATAGMGFGGSGRDHGSSLAGGGDAGGSGDWAPSGGTGRNAYGYGLGGRKPTGGPVASGGEPILIGALDRGLIDGVVRERLSEFRYCYQRQLQRHPDLAGSVVTKFVIAGDGTVSSASVKSSTIGDAAVEQCIVDRVRRLKFPEPNGNGIVIVAYPFTFAPG